MSEQLKNLFLSLAGYRRNPGFHDIAEMGIPVFLVENSLHSAEEWRSWTKHFPPTIVPPASWRQKSRRRSITPVSTLTWSEVVDIRGEYPDFRVTVRKKARYIEEEKCKGCNDCTSPALSSPETYLIWDSVKGMRYTSRLHRLRRTRSL